MIVLEDSRVSKVMIKKLQKKNICLLDYKTNEKIAIDSKLNSLIKKYYEENLKGGKKHYGLDR